jgi:hypothetical protein
MPLMIKTAEGGEARPVIVCDCCGKEIAGAGDGNCCWTTPPPDGGPQVTAQFAHKACHAALELRDPHRPWGSVDLDCLLVYLASNLGLKWEEAVHKARLSPPMG